MIRLIVLFMLAITAGLLIAKLFFNKRDNRVIDGEVADADIRAKRQSVLPFILLGLLLVGIVFFLLPRLGISVIGLLQKAIAFLPLIRGFLPF
jgi:membrane protein CcdC involved in cytochrome C biogenesis